MFARILNPKKERGQPLVSLLQIFMCVYLCVFNLFIIVHVVPILIGLCIGI